MKIELQKKTRLILLIVLGMSVLVTGGLAYFFKDKVDTKEEEVTALKYTLVPKIENQFYLVENYIYNKIYLEDSDVILNQLVHHVYSEATIDLDSVDAEYMELNIAQYEVLETYYGEDEILMWQKKTEPVVDSLMGVGHLKYEFKQEYSPLEFKTFLETAFEEYEIRPKALVKIVWEVKGTVVKGEHVLELDEKYEIPIPILDSMYVIDKTAITPKEDQVTTIKKMEVKANPLIYKTLAGVSGILLVGVLFLLFGVKKAPDPSAYQKLKKRVFNDYSDRLAELEQSVYNTLENMIMVVKFEDLVKIADEIRQPIFYFEMTGPADSQIEFFVFDDARIYHLVHFEKSELTIETFIDEAV